MCNKLKENCLKTKRLAKFLYSEAGELHPDPKEMVSLALNAPSLKNIECNIEEAKEVVEIIFKTFDMNQNPHGILAIKNQWIFLTIEGIKNYGLPENNSENETRLILLEKWLHEVAEIWGEFFKEQKKEIYVRGNPLIENNPIFHFHFQSIWPGCYEKGTQGMSQMYKSLALFVHINLRLIKTNNPKRKTFEYVCLVARSLFRYQNKGNLNLFKPDTDPTDTPWTRLQLTMETEYYDKNQKSYPDSYNSHLKHLLDGTPVNPKKKFEKPIDFGFGDEAEGDIGGLLLDRDDFLPDEDDCEEVYLLPSLEDQMIQPTSPFLPSPPALTKSLYARFAYHQFYLPYEPEFFSLSEIEELLQRLLIASKQEETNYFLLAAALIMLLTGQAPTRVLKLRVIDDSNIKLDPDSLYIDPGFHWFFYTPAKTRNSVKNNNPDLDSSTVRFPVHPKIRNLLVLVSEVKKGKKRTTSKFVFRIRGPVIWKENQEKGSNNHLSDMSVLSIDDLKIAFRRLMKDHTYKFTPSKLSAAFSPLLVYYFGLDDIIGAYICDSNTQRFGATLHYIRVEEKKISIKYLATVDKFLRHIDFISKKLLNESSFLQARWNEKRFNYKNKSLLKRTEIQRLFNGIREKIEEKRGTPEGINLHTVYTWLGWQAATGMRPFGKSTATIFPAEFQGLWIVTDKHSATNYERRICAIPDRLIETVKSREKGLKKLANQLAKEGNNEFLLLSKEITEKFINGFYSISDEWIPAPITPAFVKLILGDHCQEIENLNFLRHALRTRLFNSGICKDWADAQIGHQHVDREIFHPHSSLCGVSYWNKMKKVISDFFDEIGWTYFPLEVF